MNRRTLAVLANLLLCALAFAASAQNPDYGRVIKSSQNVGVLGKDLAGDSINYHTGAITFEATDLSVPGNNGLSVAVGRNYGVGSGRMHAEEPHPSEPRQSVDIFRQYAFGDWDLDIPYISGVFTHEPGWELATTTPLNRCSLIGQVTANGTPATGQPQRQPSTGPQADPWGGNSLHIPGSDQTMLVASAPNSNRPSTGGPYHWVTKDNWWVSCLPSIANGSGEGFLAVSPDGTKYSFNWMSKRRVGAATITESMSPDGGPPYKDYITYMSEHFMLPTRVEDRFGNWVQYSYSPDSFAKLLSVTSSDGRQLTLTYNAQGFVDTLSDGIRTIRYEYNGTSLSRVVLPDNSAWQYGFTNLAQLGAIVPQSEYYRCQEVGDYVNFNCIGYPRMELTGTPTAYVIHPAGGRVDFTFGMHFIATVPGSGAAMQASGGWALGITDKVISGPGLAPAKWYYAFAPTLEQTQAQCRAGACPTTRIWTDEISPEYRVTRRMFGMNENVDHGFHLQELRGIVPVSTTTTTTPTSSPRITRSMRINDIDIVDDPTPVTVTATTVTGAPEFYEEIGKTYRIGERVGINPMTLVYPITQVGWSERRTPSALRVTHVQGATFTWQANSWDSFDRALSVSKSSTLNPGKTDVTEFHDDLSRWVLGQVKTTSTDGIQTSRTEFDSSGLPWRTYAFGKLQQTLTYTLTPGPEAGTLATVTDGRNLTTTLSQWKRGTPQLIRYIDGTNESAVVNSVGWLMSVTNATGALTEYGYDSMGRLNKIIYPVNDTVAWNETNRSFEQINTPMLGLPAGHWRQSVSTGNARQYTYFDAMWRPVVTESYDSTDYAGTLSQVVKRYDGDGNTAFQSYPMRGVADFNAVTQGMRTRYDALNRTTQIIQDSELGPLTTSIEYLDGFKRKTTNPNQVSTVESFQVFEAPNLDRPVQIDLPENTRTTIVRDVFGKPKEVTRGPGS